MSGLGFKLRRSQFLLHVALGASLLLAPHAIGQASYTAQVSGTVTDSTGAVVVNATVTIINDGTNVSTTVHTDENGLYLLTALRPSIYTIKA
jgi:protocatechuate 3,4-dioxygenase beta subunit